MFCPPIFFSETAANQKFKHCTFLCKLCHLRISNQLRLCLTKISLFERKSGCSSVVQKRLFSCPKAAALQLSKAERKSSSPDSSSQGSSRQENTNCQSSSSSRVSQSSTSSRNSQGRCPSNVRMDQGAPSSRTTGACIITMSSTPSTGRTPDKTQGSSVDVVLTKIMLRQIRSSSANLVTGVTGSLVVNSCTWPRISSLYREEGKTRNS